MKPGTVKGERLSIRDRRDIRREVVGLARQTGTRAFTYRWDGDQKVEVRAWPNGRAVIQKVAPERDVSVDVPRLLTSLGVPARWLGVATGAVLLALEALHTAGVL